MRALEITELHERDASVGRTLRGIPLKVGLLAIRRKRVGGHVVHFAPQKRLAVLAHKDFASLNLLAQRHLDGNQIEIRRRGRSERTPRDFYFWAASPQHAHDS